MKPQYDAVRLVITNIGANDDAEAWREFLTADGWTVAKGWGTDDITAWADRRQVRTVPTRRTLLHVIRQKLADAGHAAPEGVTLTRGEAVMGVTYYRAVEHK